MNNDILKLKDVAIFINKKINIEKLNKRNYISTENMLQNKMGITTISKLPNIKSVNNFNCNDILISNIRLYFKKIWYANFSGGCSNDVLILRSKNNIYSRFLYYILSDDRFFNYANKTSKGTKMPRGDKILIMNYDIPNFKYETQEKIAKILSLLDEKIEINNKINENLEEQAMALFNSLFSDKTQNAILYDIIKEEKKSKIKVSEASNNILKYPFFTNGKSILFYDDYLINGKYIFLNTGGISNVRIYIGKASYSTDIWCISGKKDNETIYLYLLLKNINDIINKCYFEGSALKHLQKRSLLNYNIYLPNNEELDNFNKIVEPIFNLIITNTQQSQTLAQIRDLLLPKLMSGQINLDNINLDNINLDNI